MKKLIDFNTWERKDIFSMFNAMSNPFYAVTFRQDITRLYNYVKKNGISFYYALCWVCAKAINEVEEFKLNIIGDNIEVLERRYPSFTDLKKGSSAFYIVTIKDDFSLMDFCKIAKEKSALQDVFIEKSAESDDLIYFTCLPWVDITSLTNERDLLTQKSRDDSIPRIAWGKYTIDVDKVSIGISIEVNHKLIDGLHIGLFAQNLTKIIEELQ